MESKKYILIEKKRSIIREAFNKIATSNCEQESTIIEGVHPKTAYLCIYRMKPKEKEALKSLREEIKRELEYMDDFLEKIKEAEEILGKNGEVHEVNYKYGTREWGEYIDMCCEKYGKKEVTRF